MTGNSILLDTNAFIYFFEGRPKIKEVIVASDRIYYSPISEIELLSARQRIELTQAVIDGAIGLRLQHGLKVPDAIIAASAMNQQVSLVSADTAFGKIDQLELLSNIL